LIATGTGSAHSVPALVTKSQITTPADLSYFVYQFNHPNTFTIGGTATGPTGSHVDILCYFGTSTVTLGTNIPVNSGKFSLSSAAVETVNVTSPCRLRAIPSGTTPGDLTPFAGPRILVGENRTYTVSAGPNAGELYDFYSKFQQAEGAMDWYSLASCGLDDGYLSDSTFKHTTTTWYCNAALFEGEQTPPTRSELQIDGVDAWPASAAEDINSQASGLPKLGYTYQVDPKTGDAVIHDTEPFVKCANHTYPPTNVTCPSFISAGVTDHRTIMQNMKGHVGWITDVFKSTDGHSHTLDLLWENEQRFQLQSGDSTQTEYEFPGESSFSMQALSDVVNLPSGRGTVFVRVHGAPDGDTATGQGAIVYDRTATAAKFTYATASYEAFTLHQTATVPAGGSVRFRFAYVQSYYAAQVASLAQMARAVFAGTHVPNVVGKRLAAARKALGTAHCAVGKIVHAASRRVAKGKVISEKPKAHTHVDYGTKVRLVVSEGGG
jgi:hypothetical protein